MNKRLPPLLPPLTRDLSDLQNLLRLVNLCCGMEEQAELGSPFYIVNVLQIQDIKVR